MSEKVLELKHVNAYYRINRQRKQILKDVTFSIYEGDIVGLGGSQRKWKIHLV